MFRKIVSNLAFSPALVGQLGFYAKRLRKEEATRRIGLIFTALALVVQSFAVFTPPESANAASSRDFIYGGVSSMTEFLKAYDKNQNNIKDIFTYAGVTRDEIVKTELTTWKVTDQLSWGRRPAVSAAQGETKHVVRDNNGKAVDTVYSHPQSVFFKPGARDYGWVGHSKKIGWFAISKGCANLVTKKLPTPPPKPTALCSSLSITPISRTSFRLTSATSVKNGATIAAHTFSVKDNSGKQVAGQTVKTTNTSTSIEVTVPNPGTYTANSSAQSSVGVLDGGNCRKNLTVAPLPVKDITVCDLAAQKMITIKEDAFNSQKHSKNPKDCEKPAPVYVCQSLTVIQKDRTHFTFESEYSVKNGATHESTTYIVKDANGKQLYKGSNPSYTQAKAGTYFVEVVVMVKIDGKSVQAPGSDCKKSFTVTPEIPVMEKVCVLATKKVQSINTKDFDSTKHSRNLKDCEVVVIPPCPVNPSLPSTSAECQPCPGDPSVWVKDPSCAAQIIETKSARNITTQTNATESSVKAGQSIEYTVTVRNDGTQEASADVVDELYDVLEYATLINGGTGIFDDSKKTLTWHVTSLAPGQEVTYAYTVKMKDTIPAMAAGTSDRFSYDCRMVNTFGNTITVNVDCPPTKVVENVVAELPKTGPGMNMMISAVAISVVVYFYARSKQLTKEVRLIRRDLNSGTI